MERRTILVGLLAAAIPAVAAEQSQQSMPRRRPVVPRIVIERFKLQPSEYGLYVLGEDGRPYSLDDVLAVIFQIITR